MARPLRIEYPGAYYHVINRGNNQEKIFKNDRDREKFLQYLEKAGERFSIIFHTYCLMSTHFHLLVQTPQPNLSVAMQWINVSYATYFNRKGGRHGHLFQGRFKAILIDADEYLKHLSRYIHLNPLRAKLVKSLSKLDRYGWSGHGVIMGKVKYDWQDRDYALRWFGQRQGAAKKAYRTYVENGIDQGRRPELVGGGLIRSLGGWSAVKALRRTGERELSDQRILGSGEFVEQIIKEAEAQIKYQLPLLDQSQKINEFILKTCKNEKVPIEEIKGGSRRREASKVRARIAIGLVKTNGVALAEAARQLGVSTSAISKILKRAN